MDHLNQSYACQLYRESSDRKLSKTLRAANEATVDSTACGGVDNGMGYHLQLLYQRAAVEAYTWSTVLNDAHAEKLLPKIM